MGNLIGLIGGLVIGILFTTVVFWIVGKLGLGMKIDGFGPALLAALLVGLLNMIATMIWNLLGYQPTAVAATHIILTAGFLLIAGSKIKGMEVKNFISALVASLAVAGVTWLASWLVGALL